MVREAAAEFEDICLEEPDRRGTAHLAAARRLRSASRHGCTASTSRRCWVGERPRLSARSDAGVRRPRRDARRRSGLRAPAPYRAARSSPRSPNSSRRGSRKVRRFSARSCSTASHEGRVQVLHLHSMPYRHADLDTEERIGLAWVSYSNSHYDPEKGAGLYHEYLDQIISPTGFHDGVCLNEHPPDRLRDDADPGAAGACAQAVAGRLRSSVRCCRVSTIR